MNKEVKKLASEPLVWVGAVLLCVPLLASSSLKNLREALTYESDSNAVVNPFDPSEAREFELETSIADSATTDSITRQSLPAAGAEDLGHDSGMSMSLPPLPAIEDELTLPSVDESTETSPVSLPPLPMPEVAMADPGSILDMANIYQDDVENEAEPKSKSASGSQESTTEATAQDPDADDDGFDFLFGEDDTDTEENSIASESTQERKQADDSGVTQDLDSSILDSGSQSSSEPKSRDWPNSGFDNLPAQNAPERFDPPTMFGTELPGAGQQQVTDPVWSDGSTAPPEVYGQPMASPQFAHPHEAPMHSPQMGSSSEYYVELNAGPDWWTPYCHQPIWNTVPTQQAGLDAIVFAAMQNSPYVKLLNTEPQIAQTTILEADSLYDWSAFVESSWNDTNRPVVSLLDTGTAGGRFVQQQLLFEAGVKKNLRTGGHLRVGHAWQRTDNNSSFLSPADQATAQILLDYRQPLLRGAGRQVNSSQVMLAQLNFESSQNNSQALLQQFLIDVVSEYWELHFARGVLMQKLRSVERAEQLMTELASFPDSPSRNRDLARIEAVTIARRTELIRAKNEVAMRQEKLLNLTYGTSMPDSGTLEVIPVEAPGTFMVPHDLAYVTEMAVQNRGEVQVALGAIRASAVRQNLVLNDLKPRLDAIVSTFLSGVDADKDVGGAYNNSLDFNPSYAVGVSFEVPIGRRNANARIARQQLEYQRLQYQLEQTLGNVRLDARLALRNVSSIASEMENQKLAVAQAAKELQYATGQAADGVSKSADNTSFLIDDLMRSQEGLAAAESRLLRSQTDLSVALVQLKRATGQLLQTAPMPQISDYTVQQATYEQPMFQQSTYEQPMSGSMSWPTPTPAPAQQNGLHQQNAESLWAPPNTQ